MKTFTKIIAVLAVTLITTSAQAKVSATYDECIMQSTLLASELEVMKIFIEDASVAERKTMTSFVPDIKRTFNITAKACANFIPKEVIDEQLEVVETIISNWYK